MVGAAVLALALLADDPRVLTLQDALITIPDVSGPVQVVGDLDGDGHPELAIGDANFNLLGREHVSDPENVVEVRELSLEQLLGLRSEPRVGFTCGWESGCVWVYSGWPPEVALAVYGLPGTREAVGTWVERAPDVDGDGRPDLLVTSADRIHVFSTEGLAAGRAR